MNTKVSLKRAKMYYDKKLKDYFLKLVYEKETDSGIYEITLPKVFIGIPKNYPIIQTTPMFSMTEPAFSYLMFDDLFHREEGGRHILCEDEHGIISYCKTIVIKTKEVTMQDIEEKFGCKVKIITDKEETK